MWTTILLYLTGGGVIVALAAGGVYILKRYGKIELTKDILQEVIKNNHEAAKRSKKNAKKISDMPYDDVVDELSK